MTIEQAEQVVKLARELYKEMQALDHRHWLAAVKEYQEHPELNPAFISQHENNATLAFEAAETFENMAKEFLRKHGA